MLYRYVCTNCKKTVTQESTAPGVQVTARVRESAGSKSDGVIGYVFVCPHCKTQNRVTAIK